LEIWKFGKQLYVDLAKRYLASDLEPLGVDQCRRSGEPDR
jgi:hypothetical protein